MSPRRIGIIGGAAIAVVVVGGGYLVVRTAARAQRLAPFQPFVGEYMTLVPILNAPKSDKPVGKLLPIDRQRRQIDDLYFDLPEEQVAAVPEEVVTVVWIARSERTVGDYTNGALASVPVCHITVIDKASRTVIAEVTIEGTEPPDRIRKGEFEGKGARPDRQLLKYLKGLSNR